MSALAISTPSLHFGRNDEDDGAATIAAHCRACRRLKKLRRRGLCYSCYFDPSIRAAHPNSRHWRYQGIRDRNGARPLSVPTQHAPGSPEKFAVLMARAAAYEQLFHPCDVRLDDEGNLYWLDLAGRTRESHGCPGCRHCRPVPDFNPHPKG